MSDLQIVGRFTIADNDDTSDEIDLRGVEIHALVIPAAWIAADIRFFSRIPAPVGRDRGDIPASALPTPLVLSVSPTGQYRLLTSDEEGAAEGLWLTSIQSVSTVDPDVGVNQTGGPLVVVAVGRRAEG